MFINKFALFAVVTTSNGHISNPIIKVIRDLETIRYIGIH